MHNKKYQLLIFDLDDTLFDYSQSEKNTINEICNFFNIIDNDCYKKYKNANKIAHEKIGVINHSNINQFREERVELFLKSVNRNDINIQDFLTKYLDFSKKGCLISGVKETISQIKNRYIVVATNGTFHPRYDKLMNSEIFSYVDKFYCSEHINFSKPSKDFFDYILQDYNISNENILIIGNDFKTDLQLAINCNVDCCLFNYKKDQLNIDIINKANIKVYLIEEFNRLLEII